MKQFLFLRILVQENQNDIIPSRKVGAGNISQNFHYDSLRKNENNDIHLKKTFMKMADHDLIKMDRQKAINQDNDITKNQVKTSKPLVNEEVTETKITKEVEDVKEALDEAVEQSSSYAPLKSDCFILIFALLCNLYFFINNRIFL